MSARALLFFHHIRSPKKRSFIRARARALAVAGVCKTGHPGALVVQGPAPAVAVYVADVKRLRWASCTLRAHDVLEESALAGFGTGMREVDDMKALGAEMARVGWYRWWTAAMGFPQSPQGKKE